LVSLAKDDPRFEPVTTAFNAGERDEDVIAALIASPQSKLEAAIDAVNLSALISIAGGVVFYKEHPLDNSLTRRMLAHLNENVSVAPLVPFLENLELNPSRRVEQTLYEFLEYGKIPLTTDGHFLAYKAVREDWYDIYSGSMNNAVGEIVEVDRNRVDDDANATCSHGLHVCSFDYLPHFAHADGHVVIVKVNPRDVVAIPRDYNNTKMRVCRYEVVGELEGYYGEKVNYLATQSVFSNWDAGGDEADNATDAQLYGAPMADPDQEEDTDVVVTVIRPDGTTWGRYTYQDWDVAVEIAEGHLDGITPIVTVEGGKRYLELKR
jgi:hypothetical protein